MGKLGAVIIRRWPGWSNPPRTIPRRVRKAFHGPPAAAAHVVRYAASHMVDRQHRCGSWLTETPSAGRVPSTGPWVCPAFGCKPVACL